MTNDDEFQYWYQEGCKARQADELAGTARAKLIGLRGPPVLMRPSPRPSLSDMIRDGDVTVAGSGLYST